jgi:hypothetical protein
VLYNGDKSPVPDRLMNSHIIPLHKGFTARVDLIGLEKEPVIMIDNFLKEPEALVEYAVANRSGFARDTSFYPGLRMPCTIQYMETVFRHLSRLISEVFQLPQSRIEGIKSFFSMATLPGEQLDVLQRIPHFDIPLKTGIATIHFLCSNKFGGTSFYRHRSTGFEFVDKSRVELYSDVLYGEIRSQGLPEPAYINGDTALYQRIASYGAEFNRLLIYRSSSLHSGDIEPGFAGDPNPGTGRLSITSFIKGKD